MKKTSLPAQILATLLGLAICYTIDWLSGGRVHAAVTRHPLLTILGPLAAAFLALLAYNLYLQYRD